MSIRSDKYFEYAYRYVYTWRYEDQRPGSRRLGEKRREGSSPVVIRRRTERAGAPRSRGALAPLPRAKTSQGEAVKAIALRVILLALIFLCLSAKKVKPPLPSACVRQICVRDLKWESDWGNHRLMTIFGLLANDSDQNLTGCTVSFTLRNDRDSIVEESSAHLSAIIPPGGRWEFRAVAEGPSLLYTNSGNLYCSYLDGPRERSMKAELRFQPILFSGSSDIWAIRKWLKNHPEQK
jgi:hypothetical protein